jgi:hypothetical protein
LGAGEKIINPNKRINVMKNAYDKNNRFVKEIQDLNHEADAALTVLYAKYVEMGYSPRDIAHIINLTNLGLELENVI